MPNFQEFVEVDRPVTIRVRLFDHSRDVVVGRRNIQFRQNLSKFWLRYCTAAIFVKNLEVSS